MKKDRTTSTNPQLKSSLVARLPREIRDLIYLELWQPYGFRQHILWHNDLVYRPERNAHASVGHFCHWPCITEYQLRDALQEKLETFYRESGSPADHHNWLAMFAPHIRRQLRSPWWNHWSCGVAAANTYGPAAAEGNYTSRDPCWKKARTRHDCEASWSPYMPMILVCKIMCTRQFPSETTSLETLILPDPRNVSDLYMSRQRSYSPTW